MKEKVKNLSFLCDRKKMKTGRRLLLSQHPGCIVTLADQALEKKYGALDSSDQDQDD